MRESAARLSAQMVRRHSKQGAERGQRRRRWIPTCLMSAPSSCSILMAHNDALHVDRRLFQHRWLSEHLRPMRSRERSRGSLERCWPCFHTTWRSAGHAAHAGSLEIREIGHRRKKKRGASLRRCVASAGNLGEGSQRSRNPLYKPGTKMIFVRPAENFLPTQRPEPRKSGVRTCPKNVRRGENLASDPASPKIPVP